MSLKERVQHLFEARDKNIGELLAEQYGVDFVVVESDRVLARVSDQDGEEENTAVLMDVSPERLSVTCSCRDYRSGKLCSHIWATLITWDENLLQGVGRNEKQMPIMQLEPLPAPDDTDDWDEGDDDHFGPAAGNSLLEARGKPSPTTGTLAGRSSQPWQRTLGELKQQLDAHYRYEVMGGSATRRKPREVWYVVDVEQCREAGELVLLLYQRERRRDGKWGKIKYLAMSRDEIQDLTREDDRRAMSLLLGNVAEGSSGYSYYRGWHRQDERVAQVIVLPAMYDVVLPQVAATERLVWLDPEWERELEDAVPLRWDDGPPLRAQLRLEEDEAEDCWRVVCSLGREGEEISVFDPPLLFARGLALLPDRLVRLDAWNEFPWLVASRRQETPLKIPYEARDQFLEQVWELPALPDVAWPESLACERVQVEPRGHLLIRNPGRGVPSGMLTVDLKYRYGEHSVSASDSRAGIFDAESRVAVQRDTKGEARLFQRLQDLGAVVRWRPDGGTINDILLRSADLPQVVPRLVGEDWLIEADGKAIRRAGQAQFSVTSGVDWFELDGKFDFEGVAAPLPRVLEALRNGDRFLRLDDGSQGMLPDEWLQRFGTLVQLGEETEGDVLRFRPNQAALLDALLAAQPAVDLDAAFRELRDKLHDFEGIQPVEAPTTFQGTLRDYQREGLGWLHFLRDFRFGGCLADDMGLGKTVQVLALLEGRRGQRDGEVSGLGGGSPAPPRRPSLVVVPRSLVFNWIEEAERFTPQLRVLNYTGLGRRSRLNELDQFDLVVTTYGTLRRDISWLKDITFDYVILDEAQAIKNASSQSAKACRLLQSDHRLAMTGTPIENHLGELWSLFEFLNPGMLGHGNAIARVTQAGNKDFDALAVLTQALRPFILRRTKQQVLTELPDKVEQTLYCEMSRGQRKLYNELRDYYRSSLNKRIAQSGLNKAKIHVLEALLRLRQVACHPGLVDKQHMEQPSAKLETLLEQLDELLSEGHKALVFSQFTSLLQIVRDQLDSRGITYEYLDGRTRNRQERVRRFQSDAECPLFLISLKAGGHGLNLTAADYVFILDPWWNPAVEAQAVDRAHRIGQSRHVFAYRLICRDTVEEKILQLQQDKRQLAEAIITADESLIRTLSAEDLQLLLS